MKRRRYIPNGRAVAFLIAVTVALVTVAEPMQTLVAQRSELNSMKDDIQRYTLGIKELEQRQARLQDPAYVTRLARERLHFVMPGEVGYVVLEPGEEQAAGVPLDAQTQAELGPWWVRLWQGVRITDNPTIVDQQ